jgi:hypothetical protein
LKKEVPYKYDDSHRGPSSPVVVLVSSDLEFVALAESLFLPQDNGQEAVAESLVKSHCSGLTWWNRHDFYSWKAPLWKPQLLLADLLVVKKNMGPLSLASLLFVLPLLRKAAFVVDINSPLRGEISPTKADT